jgi:predicted methyltransferase
MTDASPSHTSPADQHGGSTSSGHHKHRFEHPEEYTDDWNGPERDGWQKPGRVLAAMEVEPGMTVADLGTGTGYFVPHLSAAVGAEGRVKAVDREPAMLNYVAELAADNDLDNIDMVPADPTDTHLSPASIDRVLTVNVWHHIPDRTDYASHLAGRLTADGAVWVLDYTAEAPMGPPEDHRLSPEGVVYELERGGLAAEVRDLGLPHQFAVVGHRNKEKKE